MSGADLEVATDGRRGGGRRLRGPGVVVMRSFGRGGGDRRVRRGSSGAIGVVSSSVGADHSEGIGRTSAGRTVRTLSMASLFIWLGSETARVKTAAVARRIVVARAS